MSFVRPAQGLVVLHGEHLLPVELLGLRAMFFLLAGMADRFHLLPYGLAVVLAFIGSKMLLVDVYKIPVLWSLGTVAMILAVTVALSLARPQKADTAA